MKPRYNIFYDHDKIIKLHSEGLDTRNIQLRIGCSRSTILRAIASRGLTPNRKTESLNVGAMKRPTTGV